MARFKFALERTEEEFVEMAEQILENCWIPVGERLPENFTHVYMTLKNGKIKEGVYVEDPDYPWMDMNDKFVTDVIAWMPYCKIRPYKEKREK